MGSTHDCLFAIGQTIGCQAYQAGETELSVEQLQRIHQVYDAIVAFGLEENPLPDEHPPPVKRGRRKKQRRVIWQNDLISTKMLSCVLSMILRCRLITTWLNETSE